MTALALAALQQLQLAAAFGSAAAVALPILAVRGFRWLLSLPRSMTGRSRATAGVQVIRVGAGSWPTRVGSLGLLALFTYLAMYGLAVQIAFPSWSAVAWLFSAPLLVRVVLRSVGRWRHGIPVRGPLITGGRVRSLLILMVSSALLLGSALLVAPGIRYSTSVPPDWWWQTMEDRGLNVASLRQAAIESGSLGPVAALMILTGVAIAMPCPLLIKWARSEARLHAAQLRSADPRGQVLYLRGFGDDRLRVKAVVSSRRPVVEAIWPAVRDRWESVLADISDEFGPVVSIARPGRRLVSLGAAREYAPEEGDWLNFVLSEGRRSTAIVVSLADSEGLVRELTALRNSGLLERAVLVVPPLRRPEIRARWASMCDAIRASPGLRQVEPSSALVLVIDGGHPTVFTAGRRDEATYRVAVRKALDSASVVVA